ncbi:Transcription elongation regulator 1-like protein [Sciurus carolinensis]|uniref:Transcription elongation regulator 1-like protein n=1 Tax=Sciurus carolinensis TaxID=30640 RepID=A0AA41T436_SCICA|nr:Transcription elongation regulator 1-like protein [Sciurus carolinensis]
MGSSCGFILPLPHAAGSLLCSWCSCGLAVSRKQWASSDSRGASVSLDPAAPGLCPRSTAIRSIAGPGPCRSGWTAVSCPLPHTALELGYLSSAFELLLPYGSGRTEDCQSPGPEEAQPEDRGTGTPPPQILLPLEERVTHFRDMLLERGVSAFSTWEKELHKIVFDPRYLLLNSEERKQIFEQFVKTRIKEEYKEKKSKLLLAKEEFKKLLEESKVSPRTTFKEFAEKYGRDQRFRLVQKRKDQEHFFNQFILILKKRDKENRLRLRKMR